MDSQILGFLLIHFRVEDPRIGIILHPMKALNHVVPELFHDETTVVGRRRHPAELGAPLAASVHRRHNPVRRPTQTQ